MFSRSVMFLKCFWAYLKYRRECNKDKAFCRYMKLNYKKDLKPISFLEFKNRTYSKIIKLDLDMINLKKLAKVTLPKRRTAVMSISIEEINNLKDPDHWKEFENGFEYKG